MAQATNELPGYERGELLVSAGFLARPPATLLNVDDRHRLWPPR